MHVGRYVDRSVCRHVGMSARIYVGIPIWGKEYRHVGSHVGMQVCA